MSKIVILYDLPMIMTKQRDWKPGKPAKPGSIIILPEDAILVMPLTTEETKENIV